MLTLHSIAIVLWALLGAICHKLSICCYGCATWLQYDTRIVFDNTAIVKKMAKYHMHADHM